MTLIFANIIADYRRRCTQLLQNTTPDSAEYLAYSRILWALDQNQKVEPGYRALSIAQALAFAANSLEALDENHAQIDKARTIATQWAEDFKLDTSQSSISFNL